MNNLALKWHDIDVSFLKENDDVMVNKKVWGQNKDICSLFTPAVTETLCPQNRDAGSRTRRG